MTRRAFFPSIRIGSFPLNPAEAHHIRDVLRLAVGDSIELFDTIGNSGQSIIESIDRECVVVRVESMQELNASTIQLTLATAVPKADRADWLVEKLSELGVTRWVPLKTARSVVHPAGASKFDRWRRIAVEAAKQSWRSGVMEIGELTDVETLVFENADACVLSTREECRPMRTLGLTALRRTLCIGPEGGWTEAELTLLVARGAQEASLTNTVLRIETAAIVAASAMLLLSS